MVDEAKPMIEHLKLEDKGALHPKAPMQYFSGAVGPLTVHLVVNGGVPSHALPRPPPPRPGPG